MSSEELIHFNCEYPDYEVVFSEHATRRYKEIGKNKHFILDKIKLARFDSKGTKENSVKLVNGDYTFVCVLIPKEQTYQKFGILFVVTVINDNLRKAFNGQNNKDK